MSLGIPPLRTQILPESKPYEIQNLSTEIGRVRSYTHVVHDMILVFMVMLHNNRKTDSTHTSIHSNPNATLKHSNTNNSRASTKVVLVKVVS